MDGLPLRFGNANGTRSKRLSSVNLDDYSSYLDANNHYQDLVFKAKDLEAEHKDNLDYHKREYDDLQAQNKPDFDQIKLSYDQAKAISAQADQLAELTNKNAKIAKQYYSQYETAYKSYQRNVNLAKKRAGSASWKLRVAKWDISQVKHHNNKAKEHFDYIKYELGNICSNAGAVLDGAECNIKKGVSEGLVNTINAIINRHTGYIKYNQQRAAHFEMLYKQNSREYGRLSRQANNYSKAATRDAKVAQAKVALVNRYQSQVTALQARYDRQIVLYEEMSGKWEKRNKAGVSCIARTGEDADGEYCLTRLGTVQHLEDALYATTRYQNMIGHRDDYERIVTPINVAIKAAQAQLEIVTEQETVVQQSSKVYWETLEVAANGQIKGGRFGNGIETQWNYDAMGRVSKIQSQIEDTTLQNQHFNYDVLGNLNSRVDYVDDLTETFSYDTMNRLTDASLSGGGAKTYQMVGQESQHFEYDALGNLTYKSDVGRYSYGRGMATSTAGVHALISTSGDISTRFVYDANGNQTSGYSRDVDYSSYNKPIKITKNGALNQFEYGPERQMTYQLEQIDDQTRETRYIGGLFEETTKAGVTEAVHHLRISKFTIAVLKTTTDLAAVNSTHYLHQDHLDSVVMITDKDAKAVEKNHYDAFGKKRLAVIDASATPLAAGLLSFTDRSYTGHRYLKGNELYHMKGRVYDPTFGRFLSADPHIQSPLNSQSLNRYSYVMNNPLSFNDPSGYFLSGLKKLWKKFRKLIKTIIKKVVAHIMKVINFVIRMIPIKPLRNFVSKYWQPIAIIVCVVVPGLQGFVAPLSEAFAVFNAASSFASGMSFGKMLASAALNMVLNNIVPNIGPGLKAVQGAVTSIAKGAISGAIGVVIKAVISGAVRQGLVAGISAKLMGGSFSKSFKSGFKSAMINTAAAFVGGAIKLAREFRRNPYKGVKPAFFMESDGVAERLNGPSKAELDAGAQDGHLTLGEANHHYRTGGGLAVSVDASQLTVSQRGPFGANGTARGIVTGGDYLVHGQVTLNQNGTIQSGPYDFNLFNVSSFGIFGRNIATILGNMLSGPGTPYDIYYDGQPEIIQGY